MTYFSHPNRTLCDVLEDMRRSLKTLNFSQIESLIEEAQIIGNRMEAALWDQKEFKEKEELYKKLKIKIKKMKKEIEENE